MGGRVLSGAISCGCFVMWFSDNPKSVSTQVRTYVLKLQRCFFVGAVSESSGGQSRGMQDIPLPDHSRSRGLHNPPLTGRSRGMQHSLYIRTYVQRQFCTRFLNRQRGAIMRRDCAVVLLLVLGLLLTWPREWARLCWVFSGGQPGGCQLDLVVGAVDSSVPLSCSVSGCRCSQVPFLHACRTH